jgi:hypothetical protein
MGGACWRYWPVVLGPQFMRIQQGIGPSVLLVSGLLAAGCGDSEREPRASASGGASAGEGASAGTAGGGGDAASAGGGSGANGESGGGVGEGGAAGDDPGSAGEGSDSCDGQELGAACGEGNICIGGQCAPSVCGDRYLDPAAGEQCDGGESCTGDCQLLPCARPGPCALAERDASGACVPLAIANGEPCDDGDVCTGPDQCQGGECVGVAVAQQAELRGEVTTFGASPGMESWNEGIAMFAADDQVVFLESKTYTSSELSLVQIGEQGLSRLSKVTSDIGYRAEIDWVYRPTTYLVSLNSSEFVLLASAGQDSSEGPLLEIFEIDGDDLVSHGVTKMPSDSHEVFGVASRGDTLWTCGPGELQTYTYNAPAKQLVLADRFPIPSCTGLAVSADGETLFLSRNGIRVIDVSGDPRPGDPANDAVPAICPAGTEPRDPASLDPTTCVLLEDYGFEDVQASADYVVALSSDSVGDSEGVFAITTDGASIETIPGDGYPIALGLAGDRLFVERYHRVDVWPTIDVSLHSLAAPSAEPLASYVVRDDCCGGEAYTLLSFVAQGDLAVLQPWRRVLLFDDDEGQLTALTGPEHGSLKSLVAADSGEVVAIGPYESHLVDVSSPDAPQILSGGMNLSPAMADFQLLTRALGERPALANAPEGFWRPLVQKSQQERFSVLDTSLAPEAMEIGSFWIDGEGLLVSGGGSLFQVSEDGETGIRIRRFSANAGIGLLSQKLEPVFEAVFEDEPSELPLRSELVVGVDDSGQTLVLLENRFDEPFSQSGWVVTWLSLQDESLMVLAQATIEGVPEAPHQLAVAGDQALVIGWKGAARFERDGANIETAASYLVEEARPTLSNPILARILRFDGQRALLSNHGWGQPTSSRWSVELLDADLATLASYETPEEVHTLAVRGTEYVFGMNSAISVASPECP